MRVLNEGMQRLAKPWWQAATVACKRCGWSATDFTDEDKNDGRLNLTITPMRQYNEEWEILQVNCLTCGNRCSVSSESY